MHATTGAGRHALLRGAAAGGAALALPAGSRAQSAWPERQIRFVMPFAPGGASDATARITAQHVSARLGRPVVVDDRAGAASTLY